MKLIKYRDYQDTDYIYFWINESESIISPNFNTEDEAEKWLKDIINGGDKVSTA